MIMKRERSRVPPRPLDANPDNGDPLTPWYEKSDHYDDHHVHVRARTEEEAAFVAQTLIGEDKAPLVRGKPKWGEELVPPVEGSDRHEDALLRQSRGAAL